MKDRLKPRLIAIVGPTASGKTDLAFQLARLVNGELISADSRQAFKLLDIGTGKEGKLKANRLGLSDQFPTLRYLENIPQWLTDVCHPNDNYSVVEWKKAAEKVIENIVSRGKVPIIVGGTGLYVTALFEGYCFSPSSKRDGQNPRHAATGGRRLPPNYDRLLIGLADERAELYAKIDTRLANRLKSGLLVEGQKLLDMGISAERLRQFGLEYRFLADYLEGMLTKEEFMAGLTGAIHAYARRQQAWWRSKGPVEWFTDQPSALKRAKQFIVGDDALG